jgi:hypothetical protein
MQWKVDTSNLLLTPEQVAERLSVSVDCVRDHSSRKTPRLPVIRLGGAPGRKGLLRYRTSEIEKFISELERLSNFRGGYNRNNPAHSSSHTGGLWQRSRIRRDRFAPKVRSGTDITR